MVENWKECGNREIEGRNVKLLYHESGTWKVITTQKESIASSSITLVISKDDPIEIEAETLDQLKIELQDDGDFSPNGAREILNLAR